MSKKSKKASASPAPGSPSAKAAAAASFKFGVAYVARQMGVKEASARVALRKHKIEKAEGGVYGWNSQKEADDVVNTISSRVAGAKAKAAKKSKKSKKKADAE